ncbi:MAG: ABC transporter substrate-binding protein [Thermoleophilia bacterium]
MRRLRRISTAAVLVAALSLGVAACGGGSDSGGGDTSGGSSGDPITIGYSAWPGWFPLKVAEEQGFFEKEGVNVELKYFNDYTASIDALNSGQLDANTQTLNDTIAGEAAGADLKIVVNTDFSAGNDAVIVDKSINTVQDLKGKTVAAEAGVVDHFLLLQGLQANGMTEKDIDFRGAPTDAAAAGFAAGQFDAVAVFAPFTLEALKRPGSKVLFDSADYPGSIPDHITFDAKTVAERPEDVQKVVNAWYDTVDFLKSNPEEARAIMAKQAGITPEEYAKLDAGTQILSADDALKAFTEELPATGEKINPFLVDSGLTQQPADLTGLFAPEFTQAYVDGAKG